MAKWILLVLSLMMAGVGAVGCGDFDDDTINTVSMAAAQKDGGTNGYHCGPANNYYSKAYVCVYVCNKKAVCTQQTLCVAMSKLQGYLDRGGILGECGHPVDAGI